MKHGTETTTERRDDRVRRRLASAAARIGVTALAIGALAPPLTATPAAAAAASVGNGITTTDLAAVGMSPEALTAALVGPGVTVSNVTYTGALAQAGTVHVVDPAVVSFNDGIILSSGNIADVVGPNKSDGITGDMAGAADADLNALIQNTQTVNPVTFDAAALEFDFVPTASQIYFTYTFGSDEYLEWVNLFNDVFAFYVNGTNCATVPGGDPISVDTINNTVNPDLFRDNSFANPPANPINIESDGLSVEMICSAPVNAGQTNHMKLVIADTSDQILDSVVMIKAHSLSTTMPESCNDGRDNDDDTLVDMEDDSCTSTTVPAPTGSSGVGSSGSAPPFTGNEGTPILLDASALGWTASPATLRTSWTVTGINGTPGSCEVTPAGPVPLEPDGTIAVVSAICPNEGEYVARVDGWDVEGKSSFDYDVDFFVHNAPPAVSIDSPAVGTQQDLGTPVAIAATVTDPGTNDTVSCEISWGDGTTEPGTLVDRTCTGSHLYDAAGWWIITVTGTDDAADSSAAATTVELTTGGTPTNTAPTVAAGGSYMGAEGAPVNLVGTADDADGDALTTLWTVEPAPGDPSGATCTLEDPTALQTSVTCDDNAAFTATLVADDGQAVAGDTATLTVANVDPTATITTPTANSTVTTGTQVTMSAAIVDAGSNDNLTCLIAWGDGTSSPGAVAGGTCTASHTYTQAGPVVLGLTVSDDDGGSTAASTPISVAAPAPAPTISKLSATSGKVGASITITGTNFTGATAVRFNGTAAAFTVVSATRIVAIVPAGATSGKVTVTTPGGTATSKRGFTVR